MWTGEPAEGASENRGGRSPSSTVVLLLLGLVILGAAFTLYRPVLGFQLMGDDYQWWQHAHAAMHEPALLFSDLDTFYRPASTWTLVLDRLLFGDSPAGFHMTNVLFHGIAGFLLLLVGRRLGLPLAESAAVGLLWVLAPFSEEPAVSVAIRFQDLLLMAWLGLILVWPGHNGVMTRTRAWSIGLLTLLAMASKETWIVTAALVPALEAASGRWGVRDWLRKTAPFLAAALVYTGVYFAVFPGDKGYYSADPRVLAKVPHQLAAFLGLERLAPTAFPLDWKGIAAVLLLAGLAVLGWRLRMPAVIVGSALLFLPMLPTLMVPFLPTRYTAIPYSGFLLLAAGWVAWARADSPRGWRRWATAGAGGAVFLAVLGAGAGTVRADLRQWNQVSGFHRRLLNEAEGVVPGLPLNQIIVVVRGERSNLLAGLRYEPGALAKPHFIRAADPYGLIDTAALFEWVVHREELAFREAPATSLKGQPGSVLIHRVGGFQWLARSVPDLALEATGWRSSGLPLRFIRAVRLGSPSEGR
ncbi:MAG: hypothetical protein GXP47_01520 [Acidobacteria bacterium]|nr:hypothetical protein [Acidobacteriota bacterium]